MNALQGMSNAARAQERLAQIAQARAAVMREGRSAIDALPAALSPAGPDGAWIERSWRRCLQQGLRPEARVAFDLVPREAMRRVQEEHHPLVSAARPTLERLGRALASTRYFAILTNEAGVVLDAHGPIDRGDRRAHLITRVGVDLSEPAVGTTAIGAALTELQPVWLHRGEHFFDDTGCYSCAGAPLFGPDGRCIGMLDLTGIDAVERPELKHLVATAARSIENALTVARAHRLLLRLNWPGRGLGTDEDALLVLDDEGWVGGSNVTARQMIPGLQAPGSRVHCSELFAQAWEPLFDAAARRGAQPAEVALWSGLRLSVLPIPARSGPPLSATAPLRDLENAMIRKAVAEARGNVAVAAKGLGISRATVYRKLARKGR